MAADLAARNVAVIVAGFAPAALVAKAATATIPICFITGGPGGAWRLCDPPPTMDRPPGLARAVHRTGGGRTPRRCKNIRLCSYVAKPLSRS